MTARKRQLGGRTCLCENLTNDGKEKIAAGRTCLCEDLTNDGKEKIAGGAEPVFVRIWPMTARRR
jgi:hypothetical protein